MLREPRQRTAVWCLAAMLAAGSAAASEPVVIVERSTPEENAQWLQRMREQPDSEGLGPEPGSGLSTFSAGATEPGSSDWLAPFFVDPSDPGGTTTLISVTNESDSPGDNSVRVGFATALGSPFHLAEITLGPGELRSFNVRDQPNLLTQESGLIVVGGDLDGLLSVDFFIVTPDEDFATGGLAVRPSDLCERWRSRVLLGGPFTGGTELLFVAPEPQGTGPADPPTVVGTLFNEAGGVVDSFQVKTNALVFKLDVANLTSSPTLFGYIELSMMPSAVGGHVWSQISAEGRYSIRSAGVCRDAVPVP